MDQTADLILGSAAQMLDWSLGVTEGAVSAAAGDELHLGAATVTSRPFFPSGCIPPEANIALLRIMPLLI